MDRKDVCKGGACLCKTGGKSLFGADWCKIAWWGAIGFFAFALFYKFVGYPVFVTDRSLKGVSFAFCFRFLEPKEGDLVVFDAPLNLKQLTGIEKGNKWIKRLVAVNPEVRYEGDKVYVNGKEFKRNLGRWKDKFKFALDGFSGTLKGYFVIGDITNSVDSRYIGTIKEADKCFRIK